MTVSDEEYRRIKARNVAYAEEIGRLTALINDMREVVRAARRFVDAPEPDESFLEDLRDALSEVPEEDSAG